MLMLLKLLMLFKAIDVILKLLVKIMISSRAECGCFCGIILTTFYPEIVPFFVPLFPFPFTSYFLSFSPLSILMLALVSQSLFWLPCYASFERHWSTIGFVLRSTFYVFTCSCSLLHVLASLLCHSFLCLVLS